MRMSPQLQIYLIKKEKVMLIQIINNSKAPMIFKNLKWILNYLKTIKLRMEFWIMQIKIYLRPNLCSYKIITQTKLIKTFFSNRTIPK
jgi:hypothetical protein